MVHLASSLEAAFRQNNAVEIFEALLPALCDALKCDRCFLYVRHPASQMVKAASCWRRHAEIPEPPESLNWHRESAEWVAQDPLFAASLRCEPSIFVEDVETAGPTVLNLDFERSHYFHRALIHSHLCYEGQLWGVLQPCVFDEPRIWTEGDRTLIAEIERRLTPIVVDYVMREIAELA